MFTAKPKDMDLIRSLRNSGRTFSEIGEQVGLSRSCIWLLLRQPKPIITDLPAVIEHKRGTVQLSGEDVHRFWSKVLKTDSCWIYQKVNPRNKYGYFSKTVEKTPYLFLSHRVSWMLKHGPISKDVLVCHDCPGGDNRSCVNPDHLFAGTQSDNMQDMLQKGRSKPARGEKCGKSLLRESDIPKIRASHRGGMSCAEISRQLKIVGPKAIHKVVTGVTWKHVQA